MELRRGETSELYTKLTTPGLQATRYRSGNAIPSEIVDCEAALTRSQQRFFSATYSYLAALARVAYAVGQQQGALLPKNQ